MKTNLSLVSIIFCAIFFLIHIAIYAQRAEVSLGVPVFNNVYVHFEKPISKWKNISFTSSAAYKFHADNDIRFGELFFSSVIKSNSIRRTKFDVGLRSYLVKFDRQKWLNMYVGASFLVGKMSREFNDYRLNIPKDSLTQKAVYFGPEFTTGLKIIILKKIIITPVLGLAYFFKSDNSENISKKAELWYARDWFDGEILNHNNTEARRKDFINSGFGWTPNIYLNIGYKF
ncbi:hypothetical protein [Runella aurantiaca]|uniref:DUF3575 domain-containing protein n=1 Tax=Runella aurantiaca TaxID=2282308 RepID=A0A369I923_9BACT|nr:hypothetical protein [Runella aurantiaca]RDB06108.1 hypothetical protein DVG78_09735 [Runella aurantiaca]